MQETEVTTERLLTWALFDSPVVSSKLIQHVRPELYEDSSCGLVFSAFQSYMDRYGEVPSRTEIAVQFAEKLGVDVKEALNYRPEEPASAEFLTDLATEHFRRRSVFIATQTAIDVYGGKSKLKADALPELYEAASTFSLETDFGLNYFEDVDRRVESYDQSAVKIPFKLRLLNTITNGGFERKTLNCFVAPTGFGKSLILADEALHQAAMGANVLYFTFEMDELRIAKRCDANANDVTLEELSQLDHDAISKLLRSTKKPKGQFFIKDYPPGTVSTRQLAQYIKEFQAYHGCKVDVIYVDYLNLMVSPRAPANSNSYTMLKFVCEDLVALAKRFNLAVITATQLNRDGQGSRDPELKNISESQGISNTVDLLLAMFDDDAMVANGRFMMKQLKNRYGDKNRRKFSMHGINRGKMMTYDVDEREADFAAANMEAGEEAVFDKSEYGQKANALGGAKTSGVGGWV